MGQKAWGQRSELLSGSWRGCGKGWTTALLIRGSKNSFFPRTTHSIIRHCSWTSEWPWNSEKVITKSQSLFEYYSKSFYTFNICYKITFNLGLEEEAEFSIEWSIFIIIFRWMGVGWEATKLNFLNVPSCWFPNYFNSGFVSWDAEYSWNSGRRDFFETTGGCWSLFKLIDWDDQTYRIRVDGPASFYWKVKRPSSLWIGEVRPIKDWSWPYLSLISRWDWLSNSFIMCPGLPYDQ